MSIEERIRDVAERAATELGESQLGVGCDVADLGSCKRAAQAAMVGREVSVLYEKTGRLPGQMVGKSDHLHAVHVHDPAGKVGDLVRVRVVASAPNSLGAERVG